ncbi:TetR/AcrR family transcriptional regulator [Hydrocarboniphaga sp.]|uniref:TetR/AcrR family transcriptional regulator n=1 Tax=Hydrocarboniphaga sp. TaxID=2033016 RepID=UPI003D1268A7
MASRATGGTADAQQGAKRPSQARTPQLERGRARVASLLAAGARVFAEKGYDAATMTQIAAEAGASIGSLYQFFPTKVLLAEALHGEQRVRLAGMLDKLGGDARKLSAADLADRVFAVMAEFLMLHPAYTTLVERRDVDPQRKRESRAQMENRIADLLAQTTPPLPRGRPQVIAVVIIELMKAIVTISTYEEDAMRAAAINELRVMLKTYLRAVCNAIRV